MPDVAVLPTTEEKSFENQPGMDDLLNYAENNPGLDRTVSPGEIIQGTVLSISKNEILIDLPGIGLGSVRGMELYNDEYLSKIKVGEEAEAMVIEVENEKGTVELSFRAIGRDQTWEELYQDFEAKKTVEAKVVHANKGGLMVKVHGVIGFLPASLLSPSHSIKQSSLSESNTLLKQMQKYIGSSFLVKIENLDKDTDKLIVSEKSVADEIINQKLSKYQIGDVIEGRVSGIVDFGLFVRFDTELEGLIHISELAWKKIEDPREHFALSQLVQARIISVDGGGRINLSIKQLQENPWVKFAQNTKPGDKIEATVTKLAPYGAICLTEDEIQGLCYIAQIAEESIEPAQIEKYLKVGDKKSFTVIEINHSDCRLSLSLLDYGSALRVNEEIQKNRQSNDDSNDYSYSDSEE